MRFQSRSVAAIVIFSVWAIVLPGDAAAQIFPKRTRTPAFDGPTIPDPRGRAEDPIPPGEPSPARRFVVPEDPLEPPARSSRFNDARGWAPPEADDLTAASLLASQNDLRQRFGGDRDMPLIVKAEFLEWAMRRYHLTDYHQVHHTTILPEQRGDPLCPEFGDDVSTWNGALLAAMSYKYAVTRDPETLDLIVRLVDGLHFFQTVTRRRGLVARCVMKSDKPVLRANLIYQAPNGTVFHYRSDAAKGTYNQIAAGYAVMLMLVGDTLPDETARLARNDLSEMVIHLLDHDYHITEADKKKTNYGDLTPLLGTVSVPFNAQVLYMMVAAAHHFPGGDPIQQKMIRREFERLRDKHHVYYEDPRRTLLPPQAVGSSPFVKGINDRNHVHNAAYVGLMLELDAARRQGRPRDRRFLFELGQTMAWTMQDLQRERNSLCAFMWNGLLRDPECFATIVPQNREAASRQAQFVLAEGIEQLRRAPIDRFHYPGKRVETPAPQWLDVQRPDEVYFWKNDAHYRWEVTGEPTRLLNCGTDFLHAYWLMRYFGLAEE